MFIHSAPVPRLYKLAAKLLKDVSENGVSLKNCLYQPKHHNLKGLLALVSESLKHEKELVFLLKRTKLLEKETRFNPWLARVLITELLWGKKRLGGESKPIKTILAFQQLFNAHAADIHKRPPENKVIKPRFVRVNTLLISVKDAVEEFRDEGWTLVRHMDTKDYDNFLDKVAKLAEGEFMIDMHIPEVLIFPQNTDFHAHEAFQKGLIILQDKASCLPVHLLNPQPGSIVLDMCAAPGMKTSHLAAKLNNKGTVYAVDMDGKRLETLKSLMETNKCTCVETINTDVLQINNSNCPEVKYILVDPSCSGSGIVDRFDFGTSREKHQGRIRKLRGFQIMILKHAFRRFPNVRRIIYSTCSLYPEENEEVVNEVLSQTNRFKLVNASELLRKPWASFGSETYGDIGRFCLYARPEKDLTNGFFVAVFERLKYDDVNEYYVENLYFKNLKSLESNTKNNNESTNEGSRTDNNEDEIENTKEEISFQPTNENKSKKNQDQQIQDTKKTSIELKSPLRKTTKKKRKKKCLSKNVKNEEMKTKDNLESVTKEWKIDQVSHKKMLKENKDNAHQDLRTRDNDVNERTNLKKKKQKKHSRKECEDLIETIDKKDSAIQNIEEKLFDSVNETSKSKKKCKEENIKKISEEGIENDQSIIESLNNELRQHFKEGKKKKMKKHQLEPDKNKETNTKYDLGNVDICNINKFVDKKKRCREEKIKKISGEEYQNIQSITENLNNEFGKSFKPGKKKVHRFEPDKNEETITENNLGNVNRCNIDEFANEISLKEETEDNVHHNRFNLERMKQPKHISEDFVGTTDEKGIATQNIEEKFYDNRNRKSKSEKKKCKKENVGKILIEETQGSQSIMETLYSTLDNIFEETKSKEKKKRHFEHENDEIDFGKKKRKKHTCKDPVDTSVEEGNIVSITKKEVCDDLTCKSKKKMYEIEDYKHDELNISVNLKKHKKKADKVTLINNDISDDAFLKILSGNEEYANKDLLNFNSDTNDLFCNLAEKSEHREIPKKEKNKKKADLTETLGYQNENIEARQDLNVNMDNSPTNATKKKLELHDFKNEELNTKDIMIRNKEKNKSKKDQKIKKYLHKEDRNVIPNLAGINNVIEDLKASIDEIIFSKHKKMKREKYFDEEDAYGKKQRHSSVI